MSRADASDKLKYTLKKFLEPNYVVIDDMYLEKLLVHFSGEGSTYCMPICTEWISDVLKKWKESPRQPSFTAFVLRVVGLVVSEKRRFKTLQKENAINKIVEVMNLDEISNTSIKLAYITMLASLANHDQGCEFLMMSELWKKVVSFGYENTSIYVTRESQIFISTLLSSLIEDDETACETVVSHTLRSLILKDVSADDEMKRKRMKLDEELIPVCEMASHIFEASLNGNQTSVPQFILKTYDIEAKALSVLNLAEDVTLANAVSRHLVFMYFTFLQYSAKSNEISSTDFKKFESKFYVLLQMLLPKGTKVFMNAVVQSQMIWHKLSLSVVCDPDKDKQSKFENQLICLQLMPVLCSLNCKLDQSECFDSYCNKLFELTQEVTQRLCYLFRDAMIEQQEAQYGLLHRGILTLLQVKDILLREQAVIVFQALMYTLKDFVPEIFATPSARIKGPSSDEIIILHPEVLSSILETLSGLINRFHITWRESLETICIFAFMNQLLKNPNLSSKLAVKTLQLMQQVIQNFMPPNLALLVNTLEGSTISHLGPSLHKRMHDISWEVRDSALEVLRSVTTISELKFTAFQDHILENELCSLCVLMAVDDLESYVRASALSCLSAMVRVDKFWSQCLSGQNLPLKMIRALKLETEGIVRREAAALMKELYEHNKIPKSLLGEVYGIMVEAAIKDLHWEVQLNSLDFWQKVIDRQMSNQGMIDGVFPSVTFSAEKKIVTLNEKEIQFRLGKALQEFAQLGCLQVLTRTLEDCNPRVVEKASSIVSYLSELLSRHNLLQQQNTVKRQKGSLPDIVKSSVRGDLRPVLDAFGPDQFEKSFDIHQPTQKIARLVRNGEVTSCGISDVPNDKSVLESSEKVIDAIVNESDMSLLQRVYQDQLNINTAEEKKEETVKVSVDEFVFRLANFKPSDYVSEKQEWLNGCDDDLGSLLDDILASSVGRESNNIDCY